jgi:hypothetical protein
VIQARALALKRNLRFLTAEDLIFLIRHDRAKVNRLRTYLSWKDVRKHAKDSGGDVGAGIEPDVVDEGPEGAGQYAGLPSMNSCSCYMGRQARCESAEDHY